MLCEVLAKKYWGLYHNTSWDLSFGCLKLNFDLQTMSLLWESQKHQMSLLYSLFYIKSPFISSWIMDIEKMQSEHESLSNNNLQSKHESDIVHHLNCNPLSTSLQSKHKANPHAKTLNPIAIVIANALLSNALNCWVNC